MYDYFRGSKVELNPSNLILEVAGIGYNIAISLRSYEEFAKNDTLQVFVEQYYMRDDLPVLYGFATKEEREVFRLLVSVSGVGGNTARTILSTFNASELQQIIASSNSVMLKKVKGLGQKTAEKVIVELRDKIVNVEISDSLSGAVSVAGSEIASEAITALTLLGFKRDVSQKCIRAILSKNPTATVEELIKQALKAM